MLKSEGYEIFIFGIGGKMVNFNFDDSFLVNNGF